MKRFCSTFLSKRFIAAAVAVVTAIVARSSLDPASVALLVSVTLGYIAAETARPSRPKTRDGSA